MASFFDRSLIMDSAPTFLSRFVHAIGTSDQLALKLPVSIWPAV